MRNEGESVLRIYSMLDQSARSKAKQGGYTAPFRALPPPIQQAIEAYVFFEAETSAPGPIDLDPSSTARVASVDPVRDTTVVFPNGIQPDTIVTFRIKDAPSLFTLTTYGEGPPMTEAVDDERAAQQIAMWEKMSQLEGRTRSVKLAQGRLARLDMAVLLESRSGVQGHYLLLPSFKDSDVKDVEGLPEDVRKSLKEKLEKQRALYKDMQIGGPPGKIKP
jgi:hypothetical protein